jgi:antitoxin VapB
VQVIVNLIATDERIFAFRHPLPTDKKLERYAMLVLCGRRWGLVCSVTRFVHFGRLPDDLRRKAEAVAQVDATFIAATGPGRTLGEIFRGATAAYAEAGFADEWHLHHQGGPAGYEPREYVATPHSTDVVSVGQVYAWNPSITGTKSEDTILVGEAGNEVLTAVENWPTLPVTVNGQMFARPAILEVLHK